MSDKNIAGTVLQQLPHGIKLTQVKAHASLRSSLTSAWGETHLMAHAGELVVLTRSSVFDPYDEVDLDPDFIPKLEVSGMSCDLFLRDDDGEEFRLPVNRKERNAVERVFQVLGFPVPSQ